MNVSEIIASMKRSDIFCLFLSKSSVGSRYVDFEQRLAIELVGSGKIQNFLTICLDSESFSALSQEAKFFNAIRRAQTPESAAHIINGKLISIKSAGDRLTHPFIGREQELKELESQVLDFSRPKIKCLFVSGNNGVGRKSTSEIFFSKQYPQVLRSFPKFEVESYAGYDEIYRQVISAISPSISLTEFVGLADEFAKLDDDDKAKKIASLINSLLPNNIVIQAVDTGGLLRESGALSPEIEKIIDLLEDHPHPPLIIISPRMTPRNLRRKSRDTAYLALGALTREEAIRLTSWAMRTISAAPNHNQLESLIELADFHPYNIYEIRDRVKTIGIEAFISDTSNFQAWKHKETSEYVRSLKVDVNGNRILSILLLAPELDFGTIVEVLEMPSEEASKSIQSLVDVHILRYSDDRFSISPPLKIAVERDPRILLSKQERSKIVLRLAQSLTVAIEEGSAPIALADSVVLATLESGEELSAITNALLLPSHRVWLAQRHYDAARWDDCMRLTQDAVRDRSRLSVQGFNAACRLLCLSAARLNKQDVFSSGITKLIENAKDYWAKANVEFLKGFNSRNQGKILEAEVFFQKAYKLNEKDRSTARELASICLIIGNDIDAERYARKSYELATNNPFTIDILVSALVRVLGPKCVGNIEVEELLSRLERLDNEENKSFSFTRKAEIELLYGDPRKADAHIREAIRRTPYLFEPKLLNARILLKRGNTPAVADEIQHLERLTSRSGHSENSVHRRQVLLLKSEHFIETKRFSEAAEVYRDSLCFSEEDKTAGLKKVERAQAFLRSNRNL
jgi:tetratricopeptide (TPR) repeat protein